MTTTTEFQLVDINKLVPYANNARTHNKEQILKLRSSLREFGFVNPVIIDREYNVLAGHGCSLPSKTQKSDTQNAKNRSDSSDLREPERFFLCNIIF